MNRIRASITLSLGLSMALGCTSPSPTGSLPQTAQTSPSTTIPVTASTGPTGSASPTSSASPTLASIGETEIRNHLLSTLDYVDEMADDLANAKDAADAANALRPLGGVLDDEVRWFAAHVPAGTGGPIGAYGQDIATAKATIAAVEGAGAAVTDQLVAPARAAVTALLDLRSALEAPPTD